MQEIIQINYLWESEEFVDDNILNVNIKRLRTKLEELGIINQIIQNSIKYSKKDINCRLDPKRHCGNNSILHR